MEDTQIIALYLSRQEAAIGETAKKYGGFKKQSSLNKLRPPGGKGGKAAAKYLGYGGNRVGYVSGRLECHSAGNSQGAEAFPVPDRPESGL